MNIGFGATGPSNRREDILHMGTATIRNATGLGDERGFVNDHVNDDVYERYVRTQHVHRLGVKCFIFSENGSQGENRDLGPATSKETYENV